MPYAVRTHTIGAGSESASEASMPLAGRFGLLASKLLRAYQFRARSQKRSGQDSNLRVREDTGFRDRRSARLSHRSVDDKRVRTKHAGIECETSCQTAEMRYARIAFGWVASEPKTGMLASVLR